MISTNNIYMEFKSELTLDRQIVLKGITFDLNVGDCLGILGESGSGKSTLGRILTGLLKPSKGEYIFENTNPYKSKSGKKVLSRNISVVFQDYNTSVNPRFTVAEIIKESLKLLSKREKQKLDLDKEITRFLNIVGLDESFKNRFPHQLSGGQLQRVCIARAIAIKPKIILFDEAISSLDAHTQVQIMDLLKLIKEKLNLTYVFITHDLTSVTYLCNKVMFLYNGEIKEFIDVKNIAYVKDRYAKKLLNSVIST